MALSAQPGQPRSLVARSHRLSGGSIAGIVVGVVVGCFLLFLLILPFILRAWRNAIARRQEEAAAASAAEMGMAPGASRISTVVSPTSARRLSMDQYPTAAQQHVASRPAKDLDLDGNSYEYTPPVGVNGGRYSPPAKGATALPGSDASGSAAAESAPGETLVRTESPQAIDASEATIAPVSSTGVDGQQRRKSSKSSITQVLEGFAGRAAAVFRRESTRSERSLHVASPVRSPTLEYDETLAPAMPIPEEFVHEQHLTGASAEYYSGAPLSPPEEGEESLTVSPTTYAPVPAGIMASNLISMSTIAALTGVPFEARRTGSQHTTDFSPPSPTSPPVKLEQTFEEEDEDQHGALYAHSPYAGGQQRQQQQQTQGEASSPPAAASASAATPPKQEIKLEFSSPSRRPMAPSPPLPPPGTVNPMDVWAPANESERYHQVAAELDRIDHSSRPSTMSPSPPALSPEPADNSGAEEERAVATKLEDMPISPLPSDDYWIADGLPTIAEPDFTFVTFDDEPQQQEQPQPQQQQQQQQQRQFLPVQRDVEMTDAAPAEQSLTPPLPASLGSSNFSNQTTPLTVPSSDYTTSASPVSNYVSTPNHSSVSPGASPRTFTCDECGRLFDQIHKLNHHKRYHERPHECTHPGCGMRFGTKTHLDRHVNDKHIKSRKYHCTEAGCPYSRQGGKSFPRKDNWRRHILNKHGFNPAEEPVEVNEPMTGT